MLNSEENSQNQPPGGHIYQIDKGGSITSSRPVFPSENFPTHTLMDSPRLKIAENRLQPSLSARNEQNHPVFVVSPTSSSLGTPNQSSLENVPSQNPSDRRQSVDNVSNVSSPSDQENNETSYINLTWWTTKFANQGLPLNPASVDTLPVPTLPNQQSHPLPTAAGPIHFSTRMHKVAPYHNVFSRLSPLQPKPLFSKSQNNLQGNLTVQEVSYPQPNISPADMSKSVTSKENRFKRTAEALHKSGLWDVAMKTGHLIKRNQELQKELDQFKMDALNFLKSVIKNPENRDFIKSVLNSALCAGAAESKKSIMTVVVSAAAAVAAVSVSDSVTTNSCGNKHRSEEVGSHVTTAEKKSPAHMMSPHQIVESLN